MNKARSSRASIPARLLPLGFPDFDIKCFNIQCTFKGGNHEPQLVVEETG